MTVTEAVTEKVEGAVEKVEDSLGAGTSMSRNFDFAGSALCHWTKDFVRASHAPGNVGRESTIGVQRQLCAPSNTTQPLPI